MARGKKNKENQDPSTGKTKDPRAVWDSSCDAILVETLEKQKADGRMTSNSSWHGCAWIEAEKALAGTELHSGGAKKTSDSCHNRWAALKRDYQQVKQLREKSGFGWDDTKNVVTASDEVWDALLKAQPNLKRWRNNAFPLYDTIHELVNGTVATGATSFHPGRDYTPISDPDTGSTESDSSSTSSSTMDADSSLSNIDPTLLASSEDAPLIANTAPTTQSLAPCTPANGRKRPAEKATDPSKSHKKQKIRKPTTSTAITDVASSVRELATAFATSGGTGSPERRAAAIQLIENDGELSDNEQVEVFKMIRRDITIADFITAIRDKGKRTRYIQSELADRF